MAMNNLEIQVSKAARCYFIEGQEKCFRGLREEEDRSRDLRFELQVCTLCVLGEILAEFRHLTKPKSEGEAEERKKKDKKRRAELSRF
jgi:hypothetical protein